MEILKIENLSFTYPQSSSPTLKDISFSVEKGDFTVVSGATGSGKSTLLRLLKREISPRGEQSGRIMYQNRPLQELSDRDAAMRIGFVMQNPEQQIVTDKVWHELAFGLENLGLEQGAIARRVAEMACYFGIEKWYDRSVSELSGGQKQLLNLAAVMVMDPEILVLDEPTAQLDPIAASNFISTLKKLNDDLALTVIIVEHRLEELIPICNRMLVLDHGGLLAEGAVQDVMGALRNREDLLSAMPSAVRIYHALDGEGACPLNVREGRRFIESHYANRVRALPEVAYAHSEREALTFRGVTHRYSKGSTDVLCGTDLTVYEQEIFCILGGNGSGKTTALSAAAALIKPYSGSIRVFGKKLKDYKNQSLYRECLALLPQDVQTVFLKNTVREELADAGAEVDALPYDLTHLLDQVGS